MLRRCFLLFLKLMIPGLCLAQGSLGAASAVLQREMPHLADQFHLSLQQGDYGGKTDGFRVSGTRGNIRVRAASVPTLLFGVNWYLKYVAHLNVSTNGSQLGHPGLRLPAVSGVILRPALYPFRYALNENTDGYTTPYRLHQRTNAVDAKPDRAHTDTGIVIHEV